MAENKQGQGGQGNQGGNQGGGKSGSQGGNQANKGGNQSGETSNRGFASMDEDEQREIASAGGKVVSEDREHMAEIGKKGGEHSHDNDGGGRSGGSKK